MGAAARAGAAHRAPRVRTRDGVAARTLRVPPAPGQTRVQLGEARGRAGCHGPDPGGDQRGVGPGRAGHHHRAGAAAVRPHALRRRVAHVRHRAGRAPGHRRGRGRSALPPHEQDVPRHVDPRGRRPSRAGRAGRHRLEPGVAGGVVARLHPRRRHRGDHPAGRAGAHEDHLLRHRDVLGRRRGPAHERAQGHRLRLPRDGPRAEPARRVRAVRCHRRAGRHVPGRGHQPVEHRAVRRAGGLPSPRRGR